MFWCVNTKPNFRYAFIANNRPLMRSQLFFYILHTMYMYITLRVQTMCKRCVVCCRSHKTVSALCRQCTEAIIKQTPHKQAKIPISIGLTTIPPYSRQFFVLFFFVYVALFLFCACGAALKQCNASAMRVETYTQYGMDHKVEVRVTFVKV